MVKMQKDGSAGRIQRPLFGNFAKTGLAQAEKVLEIDSYRLEILY